MNSDHSAALTSRGTILKYPTLNNVNFHTVDWIGFDPTATGDARNYLYVSTGDGGPNIGNSGYASSTILPVADRNGPYQIKPTNIYGKILRLDVNPAVVDAYPADSNKNFAIPPANPFVGGAGGALPEVMAGGLKNAFRLSFDRENGDIYLGDVGNNGQEEIDFIKSGTLGSQSLARNFGWPVKEGLLDPPNGVSSGSSFNYSNPDASVPMIDPIQAFDHSTERTIIGGVVYRGPIASLAGKYIFGDYSTHHVYTSNFDRNTLPSSFNGANLTSLVEVSSQWESLVAGGNAARRDLEFPVHFAEDSKGNLYVVSFGNSPNDTFNASTVRGAAGLGIGEIYQLVPVPEPTAAALTAAALVAFALNRRHRSRRR